MTIIEVAVVSSVVGGFFIGTLFGFWLRGWIPRRIDGPPRWVNDGNDGVIGKATRSRVIGRMKF